MLAAAIAAGGYSLLLAVRRPPLPMAEPSEPAPRPALPPVPERLARRPQVVPASADFGQGVQREQRTLRIAVEHVPADCPGTEGVAVLSADTGAVLEWLGILEADRQAGRARFEVPVPTGALWLCLAADLELAHFGYQQRVRCEAGKAGAEATLDATVHTVALTVRFSDQPAAAGSLLRCEREDDPNWHMPVELGADEAVDSAGQLKWRLPAGTYRVRPIPPGDWLPVPLSVHGSSELTANFVRA